MRKKLLICAALLIIVFGIIFRQNDTDTHRYVPQETWNVMVMYDVTGSVREKDKNRVMQDALNAFVRYLDDASAEQGSTVNFGISTFDRTTKSKWKLGPVEGKSSDIEAVISGIGYNETADNTNDIAVALRDALAEIRGCSIDTEDVKSIIIMITDGENLVYDDLEGAINNYNLLADAEKLNCEVFFISPNSNNLITVEGSFENIKKLAKDFRFGRMFFYNMSAEIGLENYIITEKKDLMIKMLCLVNAAVSGREVELTEGGFDIRPEEKWDTLELFTQVSSDYDVNKLEIVDPDGKVCEEGVSADFSVETEREGEVKFVLVQMRKLKEGHYIVNLNDQNVESDRDDKSDSLISREILENEEKFSSRMLCFRKSNYNYKVRGELIENKDDYKGDNSVSHVNGHEFNVPFLYKIVVTPIISDVDFLDEDVIGAIKKNNPHFYLKKSPKNLNVWNYLKTKKDSRHKGILLTYDKDEEGFVGYVPVMNGGDYSVTVCLTRGYKTDTFDYDFNCNTGIINEFASENPSWEYNQKLSPHFLEDYISIGDSVHGRSIYMESVEVNCRQVNANQKGIFVQRRWFPVIFYKVVGTDREYGDKWIISGTAIIITRIHIMFLIGVLSLLLSIYIFWNRGKCTYKVTFYEEGGKDVIDTYPFIIPRGKWITWLTLAEAALEKIHDEETHKKVSECLNKNRQELKKNKFCRMGFFKFKYQDDSSHEKVIKTTDSRIKIKVG